MKNIGYEMGIKGKKEGIYRLLGSILLLISLVLGLLLGFLTLNNLLLSITLILITVPPFALSILLKLEQDFFVNNAKRFLYLLLIENIVVNSIIFAFYNTSVALTSVITSSSIILLIICWHFSLSIYKKNKIIFFICGVSYILVNTPILLDSVSAYHLFIINLILLIILSLGLLLIISAELIMKKKGWLKYI
ncbi:MAG: hypothetical protein KGD72_00540 [Candidatus Lokiarchaeota archaeon]|nr:hypothetical protein [Candidatus Lokiarchaeota archaeon]